MASSGHCSGNSPSLQRPDVGYSQGIKAYGGEYFAALAGSTSKQFLWLQRLEVVILILFLCLTAMVGCRKGFRGFGKRKLNWCLQFCE